MSDRSLSLMPVRSGHLTHGKVKKRPAILRALGSDDPPDQVTVCGTAYRRAAILKHDSWAATAIYCNEKQQRIVCKFARIAPAFGIPLRWVGCALAARESRFLRKLADVELVPNDLGAVTSEGRLLPNAIARCYIEGASLRVKERIEPRLFDELRALLRTIHARDMAYVDLHKLENIIVDPDERPHLIDFQVSYGLSASWLGNGALAKYCLTKLQEIDIYHLNKHVMRRRPDTLSPLELLRYSSIPPLIRVHRVFAVPLRNLRRKLLVLLRVRDASGSAFSELEPEDSYQTPHVYQSHALASRTDRATTEAGQRNSWRAQI